MNNRSPGGKVATAGFCVNLALGIGYAWSVVANGLMKELGLSRAAVSLPYSISLLTFSTAMIVAGRFQDRAGPRPAVLLSGILAGAAYLGGAIFPTAAGLVLFCGLVFGLALAFGYAAATPAALKWFPPHQRGRITGIVVMSTGISALIWSPLINLLISSLGITRTFLIAGFSLLMVIIAASRFMSVPPGELLDDGFMPAPRAAWHTVIRSPSFILLWVMLVLAAGSGLMLTAHLVQITELNFRFAWGYLLVSLFALFNTLGRFGGGFLCDRIGYFRSLQLAFILLAATMLFFLSGWGWPALVTGTMLLGLNYGSLFSAFPAAVVQLFGLDDFGFNYGLLFTAIGVASLGPLVSGRIADLSGNYSPAFLVGLAASLLGLLLFYPLWKVIRPGRPVGRPAERAEAEKLT